MKTREIGRALHLHQEIDSTNDEAHRLADAGAPHGTVVLAEAQSKGRGRRGRVWTTPPGKALAMSIVLRPQLSPSRAPELAFVAAVAVCESARACGAREAQLKWPNDIVCRGRKLSGLLAEMRAKENRIAHVVLGIGVNVNVEEADLPEELKPIATSLSIEGGSMIPRAQVCAVVCNSLEKWLELHAREGFSPLRSRWKELASTLGQRVRIESNAGSEPLIGTAEDLDEDGALLIRLDSNQLHRAVAGDVEHLRAI